MHQPSFTDIEYSLRRRKTKREEFLRVMDDIIPWKEWIAYIKPCYPNGKRGRPPLGIEKGKVHKKKQKNLSWLPCC